MFEIPIIWDWASFALRWLHVITGIAWIGSSFYFIALDLGLQRRDGLPAGVHGEEWQVHGGGFYHIQKYMVAPAAMPEHLTWFKWESYATWLSGFALLVVVYYAGADLYLIDQSVIELSPTAAIAISLAAITGGWLLYDVICKSPLGANDTALMLVLYGILVLLAWGFMQLFSGRAAFLHLGAVTATIMSANVFLIIIPNQKVVVADLKAGRVPDAKYGKIAKQRSTHNNYLTLPVLFMMISNHYPLSFATKYSWIIAALVFLMGVTIRHFVNSLHAGKGKPWWTWGATLALFLACVWLSGFPRSAPEAADDGAGLMRNGHALLTATDFEAVRDTVAGRCSMCHAREPPWDGMAAPPKGVVLESDRDIVTQARDIYLQAGRSHAMPPGNVSYMEDEERALIRSWFEGAAIGGNG